MSLWNSMHSVGSGLPISTHHITNRGHPHRDCSTLLHMNGNGPFLVHGWFHTNHSSCGWTGNLQIQVHIGQSHHHVICSRDTDGRTCALHRCEQCALTIISARTTRAWALDMQCTSPGRGGREITVSLRGQSPGWSSVPYPWKETGHGSCRLQDYCGLFCSSVSRQWHWGYCSLLLPCLATNATQW